MSIFGSKEETLTNQEVDHIKEEDTEILEEPSSMMVLSAYKAGDRKDGWKVQKVLADGRLQVFSASQGLRKIIPQSEF